MSTSSDVALVEATRAPSRTTVLRGSDAAGARLARMDAELSTTGFAPTHAVDARLTDPHLQEVVAEAARVAAASARIAGHAAGYAAGQARAAAEGRVAAEQAAAVAAAERARHEARLTAALDHLAVAADAFRAREAVTLAEVESVVADLALAVARAVLDRELELSSSPGRDAVARALRLAPPDGTATVRLHPTDAADLADLDELAAGRSIVVLADPSVEPGGCIVDAAGRQIDAQVGPALARVAAALA